MIYTPININDNKQHLLDVFNQHKETDLHQYKIKNVNLRNSWHKRLL